MLEIADSTPENDNCCENDPLNRFQKIKVDFSKLEKLKDIIVIVITQSGYSKIKVKKKKKIIKRRNILNYNLANNRFFIIFI